MDLLGGLVCWNCCLGENCLGGLVEVVAWAIIILAAARSAPPFEVYGLCFDVFVKVHFSRLGWVVPHVADFLC